MNVEKAVFDLFEEIKQKKIISGNLLIKGISLFGEKFEKAMLLVKNQNVIKIIGVPSGRTLWKAIGERNDYLLYPLKYCQCINFNISMSEQKISLCKHLIAQKIAESLNQIQIEEIPDDEIPKLIKDAIKQQNMEDQ